MAEAEIPSALVDRAAERAAIDRLIENVRAGRSETLVLVGPLGIGKTALLECALGAARDMTVCRIAGVPSEMALGLAGVHQVVAPLLDDLGELPDLHRQALKVALGLSPSDDAVNLYLVGLAVLGLVSRAATTSPLLLVVDDAQWLDRESAKVLAFVARRLQADSVGVLVAVDELAAATFHTDDLPRLHVDALDDSDSHELLRTAVGEQLDETVAASLVSAARGNPLALVGLAGALSDDHLQGIAALPEPLPLGRQLEDLFSPHVERLTSHTRQVVVLAAAERTGDAALVRAAADELGISEWDDAVTKAEATGLVTFTPSILFDHPLARSAFYYSTPLALRRRAHAALAQALANPADADRRAWHLGAASVDTDDDVARELEAAGERARLRGGASAAAAFFLRAAELSTDRQKATMLRLEAARAELTAGNSSGAQDAVEKVKTIGVTADQRPEVAWTDALIQIVTGQVAEAGSRLVEALPLVDRGNGDSALGVLATASVIALDAGHLAPAQERAQVAKALSHAVARRELPEGVKQLLEGVTTRLTADYASAAPLLRDALKAKPDNGKGLVDAAGHHVHVVCFDAVLAAVDLLDDDAWADLTGSWIRLSRQTGALAALPLALSLSSWLEVLEGRVRTAESHIYELEEVASLTGDRGLLGTPSPGAVLLDAWQGREQAARAGARRMMQDAHERGQGRSIDQAHQALLVLELGSGGYEAALRIARRQADRDGVGTGTLALADIVEAAVRCGELDVGCDALRRLTVRAEASGSAWADGLRTRSQALLADGEEADKLYCASIEHLSDCRVVTDRARTQLLYGEWLRRNRRRRQAREPLHEALEFFEGMGATLFATRTRRELAATGERVQRTQAPTDQLTSQEAQIARLAAAGHRNREIAAQLFISSSTVEYHLRKIFVKLGVRSRTDLAALDLPS